MLDTYLKRTLLLLNDPSFDIFNEGDLVDYINMARGQIAGESESIRVMATLAVDNTTQQYAFSAFNLSAYPSVQGVINVRQASFAVASGAKPLHSRSFPYFNTYFIGNPVPEPKPPFVWSQFGQGALGSIYVNVLDGPYTLSLDCSAYPVPLVDDTTAEALPYQWTDAVPFYSAYYAAMTKNDGDKSDAMWKECEKFVARARMQSTPAVLPGNFAQPQDPFIANRLGLANKGDR